MLDCSSETCRIAPATAIPEELRPLGRAWLDFGIYALDGLKNVAVVRAFGDCTRRVRGRAALSSDAGHNFTDALALLLAWFGVYLQAKPANETQAFAYYRGGVLTAFINASTLEAIPAWIFYESDVRLARSGHCDRSVL